ncbi:MAG TPA: molybdate ABC transporter substrate-binding protein, partial [Longimicrobium sp.]|nr:molybdate ABC transporter substrate-binding protein [Longimicrobium sp.]
LALLTACGGKDDRAAKTSGDGEVMVFAAASLREAMEELGDDFTAETGTPITFNFAGSNDLAHQIAAGRGMDLFLSASEAWMDTAQSAGRLVAGTRRDLLSNALVVVERAGTEWRMETPCDLASLPFTHLAMGDPEAVPAGTYARRWLQSVDCGGAPLWDAVKERVAPAPDVRAALGLVLADPRVAGMVYRTDVRAFAGRATVLYEVKDGPPIRYAAAQVAEGGSPESARRFLDFLSSPKGAEVFTRHGFTPLAISPSPSADSTP